MSGPILTMLAPFVVQFMKWFGYKEAQIQGFLSYVAAKQKKSVGASQPSEEDAEAEAKLKAKLESGTQ